MYASCQEPGDGSFWQDVETGKWCVRLSEIVEHHDLPDRETAEFELARLMVNSGTFTPAWIEWYDEKLGYGDSDNVTEDIYRWITDDGKLTQLEPPPTSGGR